jgi:hypothetical protein
MRRNHWLAVGSLAGLAGAVALAVAIPRIRDERSFALVREYCVECHNPLDLAGEVSFQGLDPDSVPQRAELFEHAIRKLRGRQMPPPGSPQPEAAEIDRLVAYLERSIDQGATPRAGYVAAQRLSRAEYASAVQALLGVDIDPVEHLPAEIEVDGFANIAAALSTSPAFVEQYVNVAGAVAHLAVGEPKPKVATAYFPPPKAKQDAYVPGLPLGTRGGMKFTHAFPADGEYRITVTDLGVGLYPRALETKHTLVVLVDRGEQFRADIGGPDDLELVDRGGAPARAEIMRRFAAIPLHVTAGVHEVAITFVERARAASDEQITEFTPSQSFSFTGAPRVPTIVGGVNLVGPFDSTGLTRTASRAKLFVCEPEVAERERECAEEIAASLARRAFRRPVSAADLERLMPFYDEGRKGPGGFDEGVELLTAAVLASPDFLYRAIAPRSGESGGAQALDSFELASRLSFFLWGQGPDDELLALAESGALVRDETLDAQIERMLADPRAEVLVTRFALGWLGIDDLEAVQPDKLIYPEFTESLREDFAREIELFLASILLGAEDVRTLLTADYTFLNERLARHYGIDGVVGPQFRRVALAEQTRRGLLGKGAVLLRTSYGDRTSPVLRGAWVLRELMGTPPTPPPPGVETNLSVAEGEPPTTVRARLEAHRTSYQCNACHGVFDPYGLALENFTATGRWRDRDEEAGAPIDARAELPGGATIEGPAELTAALLEREDQFVQALTENLMMYAIGRQLEYYDMPQVRKVVRDAAAEGYRFFALVAGIVGSDAFRMQGVRRGAESAGTVQAALGVQGGAAQR